IACPEKRDRLPQPFLQRHFRFPAQQLTGAGNVWTALLWISLGQRRELQLPLASDDFSNGFCELEHGHFVRVSQVDRIVNIRLSQAQKSFNQIRNVTEGPRLLPVAKDGEVFALQSLMDECRNDAPIVEAHPRSVGVEDAGDARLYTPHAVIGGN